MRASLLFVAASMALGLGAAGCRGCLDIDEYTLVPGPPPDAGFGGSSSSSGTGGADACQAPGEARGTIMMASVVGDGEGAGQNLCNLPASPPGAVDLLAIDPGGGACIARGAITPVDLAEVALRPQIMHRLDDRMVVIGDFNGELQLPIACGSGIGVTVTTPPAARQRFIAALRVAGSGFCTAWASSLWTAGSTHDFGYARARMDASGVVVAAGALGPDAAFFGGGPAEGVRGGPFFARYQPDSALAAPPIGELATLQVLGDEPGSLAVGLGEVDGAWWATGRMRSESPSCHGCPGASHVLDAAAACPPSGSGGAGGAGGAGGGGGGGAGGAGSGGTAGAGGSGGSAVFDSRNAFLWRPGEAAGACNELETFGADGVIADDQTGFDVASAGSGCGRYWGGIAGRAAWRLGDAPETALFDAGGASVDGFLARLGATAACPDGGGSWSVRLVSSDPSAPVSVERVAPKRCTPGVTSALTVPGSGSLAAVRCAAADGTCQPPASVPLTAGASLRQLALTSTRGDGALDWSVAFGPLAMFHGAPLEQGAFDLATDERDWIYLTFVTDGALSTAGLSQFGCEPLVDGAGAGRWLVALQAGGFDGEAICAWAQRFGTP